MTQLPDGFLLESSRTTVGFPVRENMCARLREQRTENRVWEPIHEGSPMPSTAAAEAVDNPGPSHPAMDGATR